MDMLSFDSLHASCVRMKARRMREQTSANMLAAQGTSKAMKEADKSWEKLERVGTEPDESNDAEAFLARFGAGI